MDSILSDELKMATAKFDKSLEELHSKVTSLTEEIARETLENHAASIFAVYGIAQTSDINTLEIHCKEYVD